jgi:H+-transporting ATPase
MSRHDLDEDIDEEEDEDIDALIDELESQDGDNADYEEEEVDQPGGARVIPEDLLQTDTRTGLNSAEVLVRRKKFGYNQMKGTTAYTNMKNNSDALQRKRRISSSSS